MVRFNFKIDHLHHSIEFRNTRYASKLVEMFSKHPNAKNSRFPPLCPVYICDIDEDPPGIDAQGVVVEVGLEASSKKIDSFDTVYKIAVKCKNERGELYPREEIVRPERLIYKNNCNVYLKVPNATTDDNTSTAKREAVVTGFHMLSCSNTDRTRTVNELRYIVQEADGKKVVHNRVHPELVSFRHIDEAKDDLVEMGSNATDPNLVRVPARISNDEMDSEVKKHQQIPKCINVTDRKQDEISSTTLEEVPSQRNDFQMQPPQKEVKETMNSTTNKTTCFGESTGRALKDEEIDVEGDKTSLGQRRKHNTAAIQSNVNENQESKEKSMNPVMPTQRADVSNASRSNRTSDISRSLLSTPSIESTTNECSRIDSPLKSARSSKIGHENVKRDDVSVKKSNTTKSRGATRKKEYMYHINLDSFNYYELEEHLIGNHSSKYKRIIKDTNCDSFHIDKRTPSIQILADSPSNVEKAVRYIIKILKEGARRGRNRLSNFIFDEENIVETFFLTKKSNNASLQHESNQREQSTQNNSNHVTKRERKADHGNERQGFTSRLYLPIRLTTAWDILVGDKGVTHKALVKITQCSLQLRSSGSEDSCITMTGRSRSILDRGISVITDTLAKNGVKRRRLEEIEIINEWETHPKKKPRRR